MHSTNYKNTFIEVSPDCPVLEGTPPFRQGTIAQLQFQRIAEAPYRYDSDELIFGVFTERNHVSTSEVDAARTEFFSKGQPCLRTSPLVKTYGWGVHHDQEGRVAIFGSETDQYAALKDDSSVVKIKGMRSRRKVE